MKSRIKLFVAAVVLALGITGLGATAPATAATACPRGAVCIYYGKDLGSGIKYTFYSYGAHNIYNMTGDHLVINNQTDGAGAYAMSGSNGSGRALYRMIYGGGISYRFQVMNLTPVWSFTLVTRCHPYLCSIGRR